MQKTQVYIVATPIGNMGDISSHALKILSEVDYIACEDTRVTKKLLDKYKIQTKLFAYHKFNEKLETQKILEILEQGQTIALVSDAGTPCVCDPGKILLKSLYENKIKIESVSGCCAISTFLSLLPRDDEKFVFIGFLEKTFNKQKEVFEKFKDIDLIFYESPNRIIKTLQNIQTIFADKKQIAVGRELTKIYEEIKIGTSEELIEFYTQNPPKGEIVCMLYGQKNINFADTDLIEKAQILLKQGFSKKDAVQILVSLFDIKKNDLYKIVH